MSIIRRQYSCSPWVFAATVLTFNVLSQAPSNPARADDPAQADTGTGTPLRLTLPPSCYAVVGQRTSIYFDNLVLQESPGPFDFEVQEERDNKLIALGTNEARRWTLVPEQQHVGPHRLIVRAFHRKNRTVLSGSAAMRLQIVPADAGASRKLAILLVGDSLTNATIYPNELAKLLSQPGNPQWKMLGTHRPASAAAGVSHEGYGGWTWEAFGKRYVEKPDLAKRQFSSPFVFVDAQGHPQLDPGRYFNERCGGERPDVITFLLGINDCFAAPPNDPAKINERIDVVFQQAEQLLAATRKAAPTADLVICLTPAPNSRQKAFEANYKDRYTRWGWKRIQHQLVEREIRQFRGREPDRIFLAPTELNVDPIDGYPEDNAVHPNATGYRQIADTIYAWLKWRLLAADKVQ